MLLDSPRAGAGGGLGSNLAAEAADDLYDKANLNEKVDPLDGVRPQQYANIVPCATLQREVVNSFMAVEELALIAFWDLNKSKNIFECSHHFYVPSPKKRNVKQVGNIEVYQVLYSSPHSKDVFFFFEAPAVSAGENISEMQEAREKKLQCAFLKLTPEQYGDEEESPEEACSRIASTQINAHCEDFKVVDFDGLLGRQIEYFHRTPYHD